MRRITLILLACLVLLSGCRREQITPTAEPQRELDVLHPEQLSYYAERINVDFSPIAILPEGNEVLLVGSRESRRMNPDTRKISSAPFLGTNVAAASEREGNVYCLCSDEDGVFVNQNGELIFRYGLEFADVRSFYDGETGIYTLLAAPTRLYRNEQEIDLPEYGNRLIDPVGFWKLNGTEYLAASGCTEGTTFDDWRPESLLLFPLQEDGLGEPVEISGFSLEMRMLSSDGEFGYFLSGSELYQTDGHGLAWLGNLTGLGIDTARVHCIVPISGARILVSHGNTLTMLCPGEEEKDAAVRIAVWPDWIPDYGYWTAAYLAEHPDVNVEVKAYEDLSDLNLAILSGEADVLFLGSAEQAKTYAVRDILAPMDGILDKERYLYGVLKAGSVDGCLYMMPLNFRLYGMCLPDAVVEAYDYHFENYTELQNCLDEIKGPAHPGRVKEQALGAFLSHGLDAWVDWEKSTADFSSPDFIWILEYCNQGYADTEEYLANTGSTGQHLFLYSKTAYSPYDLLLDYQYEDPRGSRQASTAYGMKGALIPSPGTSHEGLAIQTNFVVSLTANGENRLAAAEFVAWLLSDSAQGAYLNVARLDNSGYSPNRKVTDRLLSNTLTVESEDFVDSARQLLNDADHYGTLTVTDAFLAIIQEEAMGYFSGDCTAEQCAERIQNRVSIYMAEQG